MSKQRFLVSLTTNDNDYQIEQAESAEQAARNRNIDLQIVYAGNDAVNQSMQILKAVQAVPGVRPSAVVFEPVGSTALPQVARAAASAGIGWAILNREANYLAELRQNSSAPLFSLSSDHLEIGRIQGRQFAALLPQGGAILYIQGPTENSAAKERTAGMQQTKPANIQVTVLKGQWTEESAQKAVRSWLKLSTSQRAAVDLVAAQDDSMAIGARKAFEELPESDAQRWLALPFLGCDGLPKTGQAWVQSGLLAATVFVPPNAGQAIEMLVDAMGGRKAVAASVLTVPKSIPSLADLKPRANP
ncbi:MAG: substrate-binding domain-containing protein [Candidatus Acidiferrum sp.]|jgi:ABC-type sugar transport system substrate-binding protein